MKKKKTKQLVRGLICLGIAGLVTIPQSISLPSSVFATEATSTVTFERNAVTGEPIFDGVAAHMDAFVDLLFKDMSLHNKATYAIHILADADVSANIANMTVTLADGRSYVLPDAKGEVDAVQGVTTEFPTLNALGQSWNTDLLNQVGTVMGNERRGDLNNYAGMTMMYSVVSDTRANSLSGRYDEDYSEDASMVGDMVSAMGNGIVGNGASGNEDGFWVKVGLGTKHYSNYSAQFFRQRGSFFSSLRSLYEIQLEGFKTAVENGSVNGVMTSYGRTNGVPNAASPLIPYIENANSKYALWNVADFRGDNALHAYSGNGYDTIYCNNKEEAAALLALSGATENSGFGTVITTTDLENAVTKGIWGVTESDVEESIRGLFELFIRTGCFNADEDSNGQPDGYPFANLAKDVVGTVDDAADTTAQAVAYNAAEESIVLLKNNNNVLPLKSIDYNVSNKLTVTGPLADARFKSTYAVSKTPSIANAGYTPLVGIENVIGNANVEVSTGTAIIAIQSGDGYLTVPTDTAGGKLTVAAATDVSGPGITQQFEVYSWGMDGYSYKSCYNGRWLTVPSGTAVNAGYLANTSTTTLSGSGTWDAAGTALSSTLPDTFRLEENADGTVRILSGSFTTGFGGGWETSYYTSAKVLTIGTDVDKMVQANQSTTVSGAAFTVSTVKKTSDSVTIVGDTVVMVVGNASRFSAGEGSDRTDLAMGDEMYDLVARVSAAAKAKDLNTKTVVILKTCQPVIMEQIQNNTNVDAVIYQPYAGEYDGYALGNVLFGSASPSGHLTGTWYNTMSVFPKLTEYDLPEGEYTLANIDPRITVDMTDNDAIDTDLTYMYHTDESTITYPFGYGLSYATFNYSNFTVPVAAMGGDTVTATVDVTNTSSITAKDVVQIYATPANDPAYGSEMYSKKLLGYTKVEIAAGETKTVSVTCDLSDLEIYDVNKGSNIVENGAYTISLATSSSSKDVKDSKSLNINGSEVSTLNLSKTVNVADHTFATHEVTYREASKGITAAFNGGYFAVMSKNAGSYVTIPNVDFSNASSVTMSLTAKGTSGTVELRKGSANGALLATLTATDEGAVTQNVTYTGTVIDTDVQNYEEMKYVGVTSNLTAVSGVDDLYIVFSTPKICVDTISFAYSIPGSGTVNVSPSVPTTSTTPSATPGTTDDGTVISAKPVTVSTAIDGTFVDASGNKVTSSIVVTKDGTKYIVDEDGATVKDTIIKTEGNSRYYATETGAIAVKQIVVVDGKKYYATKTGELATKELVTVDGKKYYAGSTSVIATKKLITVDGAKYYAGNTGVIVTKKLITVNEKKYYATKSGKLAVSTWVKVGEKSYYCNKNGVIIKTK